VVNQRATHPAKRLVGEGETRRFSPPNKGGEAREAREDLGKKTGAFRLRNGKPPCVAEGARGRGGGRNHRVDDGNKGLQPPARVSRTRT